MGGQDKRGHLDGRWYSADLSAGFAGDGGSGSRSGMAGAWLWGRKKVSRRGCPG